VQNRVKRSVLTAFCLSVLIPFGGLFYVHRVLDGLLCTLMTVGILIMAQCFELFHSFQTMIVCLGLMALLWFRSLVVALFRARCGLTPEEAQHDIGPWVAAWLLVLHLAPDVAGFDVGLYGVRDQSMEPVLKQGEFALGTRTFSSTSLTGRLVVLEGENGQLLIRKVLAVSGDVLEARGRVLFRNGQKVGPLPEGGLPGLALIWQVPDRSVYVMAENSMPSGQSVGQVVALHSLRACLLHLCWSGDISRLGAEL